VPASISVVTHDQIVDQDAQSVSQSLRYTPGIVAEQRGINEDRWNISTRADFRHVPSSMAWPFPFPASTSPRVTPI
jgi:hypothetical protein